MKSWRILLLALFTLLIPYRAAAQKSSGASVPKYDKSAEAVFKGTVGEVHDRQCPVSGGMGSHLELKQADGSVIEVHLALTKFVRQYAKLGPVITDALRHFAEDVRSGDFPNADEAYPSPDGLLD